LFLGAYFGYKTKTVKENLVKHKFCTIVATLLLPIEIVLIEYFIRLSGYWKGETPKTLLHIHIGLGLGLTTLLIATLIRHGNKTKHHRWYAYTSILFYIGTFITGIMVLF